uniref:Uncharacterized protein n=1 Tax=Solanum lycopersicum TaxID=4081 RepID=A0A3Q7IHJ9_SOLLC
MISFLYLCVIMQHSIIKWLSTETSTKVAIKVLHCSY